MEVLIAAGLSMIIFAAILSTIMSITAMSVLSRHHTQAMHVVRGQIEELKGMEFDEVGNSVQQASYDAGPDNVFGTGDDLTGTLTVSVVDALDFDDDDNVVETTIDVDGDGVNDCFDFPACTDPYAKPFRITFVWNERLWTMNKNMTIRIDSMVSQ